jgi:NADPH2:quinone reductase
MRAAIYPNYGLTEAIKIADIKTPEPGDGEALVRVAYAGINPIDWKVGEGRLKAYFDCEFPLVVGRDISGVIVEVSSEIKHFTNGDKVFAALAMPGGGLAEYVSIPAHILAKAPQRTSLKECAALPLASLTCWQSLIESAGLARGQIVFILSGAGGTGSLAVQISKSKGATVITTCSPGNFDYVKSLGADFIYDYARDDVIEEIRSRYPDGIDLVFSNVLGELHKKSYSLLRNGGKLVTIGESLCPELGERYGVNEVDLVVRPDGGQLGEISRMVDNGSLRPPSITEFPFERCQEAMRANMSGHTKGKIVVKIAKQF